MVSIEEKRDYIEKAVEYAKGKGFKEFKAKIDEYDDPKAFTKVSSDNEVLPDFTAKRRGKKHYFDIAMKTDNVQALVTKWKLLNQLAEIKNSKLILFAPRGHKAFTERLTKQYKIDADVLALS
ncbi:hypothetical protein [Membranihabitans maritimus]|uniref:hypothetical protein n=1 Tax=Membranihabitans maritimus TaxID=2904244 RepID=UPI001F481A3B|nr:hypothetical protein [Membranihabitans maritimus]